MLLSAVGTWLSFLLSNVNITVLLCVMLIVISWIYMRWWQQPIKKHPPGLFPWPIVGNAPFLGPEPHKTFHEWALIYGPIYKVKLGGVKVVVLSNLPTIKEALLKQKHIFSGRPQLVTNKHVWEGKSIMVSDDESQGDLWKKRKSLLVRHLHILSTSTKIREEMNELITEGVLYMIREMESSSQKDYFDPREIISKGAANHICGICFGKRYDYDDEKFCELLKVNSAFGEVAAVGGMIDVMPWILIFSKYRKALKKFIYYLTCLCNWLNERVKDVLSTYDSHNSTNVVTSILSEFLDQAGTDNTQELTENDREFMYIVAFEIFAAGQDTTPAAFTWILNYLLLYPDVSRKIKENLDEIVGDRLPTLSDRSDLPYIEAFLHEVFRHSSLSPSGFPHRTLQETTLEGYHIPKDTMIFINQYSVNRDPENWKEPEKFDPMRFLSKDGEGKLRINEAAVDKYMLFSMGLRKCPGAESAKMWLFLATSILVQTCDLQLDPAYPSARKDEYSLTLRPDLFKIKLVVAKK